MDNEYEVCLVNIKKDSRDNYTSYVMFKDNVATCDDCFCGKSMEKGCLYCCDCIFKDNKKYTKRELILNDRINKSNCMAIYNVGINKLIMVACGKGKEFIACKDVLCINTDCDNCKLKKVSTSELEKLN